MPDHSVFECVGEEGFNEELLMLLVTMLQYGLFSSKAAFAGCGLAFWFVLPFFFVTIGTYTIYHQTIISGDVGKLSEELFSWGLVRLKEHSFSWKA